MLPRARRSDPARPGRPQGLDPIVVGEMTRVAVIRNPESHGNRMNPPGPTPEGVRLAEPFGRDALRTVLEDFAREGLDLLVIDGGDGTVRDVISLLPHTFGEDLPLLAVLPSGKTNVLAIDLGTQRDWRLEEALNAARQAEPRIKSRPPLRISWVDGHRPCLQGFFFGVGALVKATNLSQKVHKVGFFHNLAVGVTIATATLGALFGGARDEWREGVPAKLTLDGETQPGEERFAIVATALKRLPFGLKPFGEPREGLKILDVDAPPRKLLKAMPLVLSGKAEPKLESMGYRRRDPQMVGLAGCAPFVLDGEVFEGGELVIALGPALRFLVG
ncbi:diacylglycerol kinase family protein [uncultured Caulobacter sp.]|uniref:diacylglycerol/lipid kinase family protein n=1 Tax=uncultured Caulobacter sp. TaxID=158749 RepID=UPI0026343F5B|nr:diacylglycerol kinase family protein [uncultured Caulobacter sp.]